MIQKSLINKILLISLMSFVLVVVVWQGIFWFQCFGEYREYNKFSSGSEQTLSFGDWANYYASLHMFMVGDLLKYQRYKKYVMVQEHFGEPVISWEKWKEEMMESEDLLKSWMNETEERLAAEKADTYGGDTPEETWKMFLDALRNNDLELASKYFVLDKQQEHLEWFQKVEESGLLEDMISDLTVSELEPVSEGDYRSEYIVGEEGQYATATVIFNKNINNKWKLESI